MHPTFESAIIKIQSDKAHDMSEEEKINRSRFEAGGNIYDIKRTRKSPVVRYQGFEKRAKHQ